MAFCLAAYLPGIRMLPPLDGDESRYLEASRQMVTTGTPRAFVVPQIDGAPRLNKPPLVYWVQATSAWLLTGGHPERLCYPRALEAEMRAAREFTGSPRTRAQTFTGGAWVYRVPSVLATLAAVLITRRIGLAMFSPACAWLAAALLGMCFIVVLDARLARTDQILLMFTCAAQWALWNLWRNECAPRRWAVLLWVAVGLGIMTKGPVTPAVAVLTMLALSAVTGQWAWLRRVRWGLGGLILALIVAPWLLLAMYEVGWETFWTAITTELLTRGLTAQNARGGPPGYHLVLLPGLFWPGGLLVVPAFIYAFRHGLRFEPGDPRRERTGTAMRRTHCSGRWNPLRPGRPAELFCLAWIVPAWVICELIETKLPHYTLPLYPAVALLCARAAWAGAARRLPLMYSRAAVFGDAMWILVGAALYLGLPLYLAWKADLHPEPGILISLLTCVLLFPVMLGGAWTAVRRKRFIAALLVGLCGSIFGARTLFQVTLPHLDAPWIPSALVREVALIDPAGERPLASAGFFHESLLFMTGGHAQRIAPAELDEWLDAHPNGLAIVPADYPGLKQPVRRLASVEGFDYIAGESVVLHVVEHAADAAASGPGAAETKSP